MWVVKNVKRKTGDGKGKKKVDVPCCGLKEENGEKARGVKNEQ